MVLEETEKDNDHGKGFHLRDRGRFGKPTAQALLAQGHAVAGSVRRRAGRNAGIESYGIQELISPEDMTREVGRGSGADAEGHARPASRRDRRSGGGPVGHALWQ